MEQFLDLFFSARQNLFISAIVVIGHHICPLSIVCCSKNDARFSHMGFVPILIRKNIKRCHTPYHYGGLKEKVCFAKCSIEETSIFHPYFEHLAKQTFRIIFSNRFLQISILNLKKKQLKFKFLLGKKIRNQYPESPLKVFIQ